MITFLKKLHIHPLLLLFIVLSLITGTFVQLFVLFSIIFIHELGHYMMANHFNWKIQAIILWVFGGVMQTSESTNRPIREDVIVTLAGPLQHLWMFGVLYILTFIQGIPAPILEMAFYYNWLLLAFNLLPIYPLDGGKLLFYTLSMYLPFKKAHQYTFMFSLMACLSLILFITLFYPITLSAILLLLFLMLENYREWRNHPYTFMRFLLNRQQEKQTDVLLMDGSHKLMDVFSAFRRNRYHLIKIAGIDYTMSETEALAYYFKKRRINDSLFQLTKNA